MGGARSAETLRLRGACWDPRRTALEGLLADGDGGREEAGENVVRVRFAAAASRSRFCRTYSVGSNRGTSGPPGAECGRDAVELERSDRTDSAAVLLS